jgi:alpha-ketoglutarate-dependent taurine dioxygenase
MGVTTDRFDVSQIAETFGAMVSGIRISGDVPQPEFSDFLGLFHRYHVLVVPTGGVDPADLVGFSRRFGELEIHARTENTLKSNPEIFCVGNAEEPGRFKAAFSTGVEQWHGDSSYRDIPSDASLFLGVTVPPEGGDTWFCDASGAYRDLPDDLKQQIEALRGVHDLFTLTEFGRRHSPWRPSLSEERRREFPPVSHPLVRRHPVTGEKSLFICPAVISHIEGMSVEDSAELIGRLADHATQDKYVYRHKWRQGDLVIWDNRCVLHTASLFDHTKYQRLMFRTTVAGNQITAQT